MQAKATRDPNLTPTSFIVLGLLEGMGEGSVYDLKQVVTLSVGNFWSVPHSQLYREGERLEAGGYLDGRDEPSPGGRPRRVYSITDRGRRALDAWRATPGTELPELRDPGLLQLFFGAPPAALAQARLEAHRRQLEAYEERRRLDDGSEPRGIWLALDAGIAHEREWVRFWTAIAAGETRSALTRDR
jgi:PadR family transcriptional regulator AphA